MSLNNISFFSSHRSYIFFVKFNCLTVPYFFWGNIHLSTHSCCQYSWKWDLSLHFIFLLFLAYDKVSGSVWQEDSYVLSLMSPLSLFKRKSMLLPGTEIIVWGRLGSPLVNILFRTKLLSLAPLPWDMDCLLTLWLTLPRVPLVMVAVRLVFWSLSFPKEVSCITAYIYSEKNH